MMTAAYMTVRKASFSSGRNGLRRSAMLVATLGLLLTLLCPAAANATCPTFTTLANGTAADATKVMDNFNYILGCPNFTGNVGIGTATPSAPLDVYGAAASSNFQILHLVNPNITTTGNILFSLGTAQSSDNSVTFAFINNSTASNRYLDVSFWGHGGQFVIKDSGNVAIGHASPVQKLDVAGYVLARSQFLDYTSSPQGGNALCRNATSGIHSECSSDRRLKTNIVPIDAPVLSTLMKLRPVEFNWKSQPSSNKQAGFIAQEVKPLLPLTVEGDESKKMLAFTPGNLVPYLVKGMQELKAITDKQAAEIVVLRAQLAEIDALKRRLAAVEQSPNRREASAFLARR